MICRRTMDVCMTPSMCAPFQGCVPNLGFIENEKGESGFFDIPQRTYCQHEQHNPPIRSMAANVADPWRTE